MRSPKNDVGIGGFDPGGEGGGADIPFGVPPQRVWFLSRFGLKTGIDIEHFGLKLGMVT